METIIRDVRDLNQTERSALERVVGQQLMDTQRVIVKVVNLDVASAPETPQGEIPGVPDWWRVYEGLSDEEVDRLDATIRERANLTRSFE